jgi:hypothetical protein
MTTRAGKARVSEVNVDGPASSPLVNLRKQAKYVVLGGGLAWYWQVWLHLSDAVSGTGWPRCVQKMQMRLAGKTSSLIASSCS